MAVPVWVVTSVTPKKDYTLHLTFADGSQRVYDVRPLLQRRIYEKLNDLNFFMGAKVFCGSVAWSDDIDIAPERLYSDSVPIGGVSDA